MGVCTPSLLRTDVGTLDFGVSDMLEYVRGLGATVYVCAAGCGANVYFCAAEGVKKEYIIHL